MKKWIAVILVLWFGSGLLGAAGSNAWTQRHFDLGCGSQARKVNLGNMLMAVPLGPANLFVSFLSTGFFSEGLSLRWCPDPNEDGWSRFCQCDERN